MLPVNQASGVSVAKAPKFDVSPKTTAPFRGFDTVCKTYAKDQEMKGLSSMAEKGPFCAPIQRPNCGPIDYQNHLPPNW